MFWLKVDEVSQETGDFFNFSNFSKNDIQILALTILCLLGAFVFLRWILQVRYKLLTSDQYNLKKKYLKIEIKLKNFKL